MPIIREFVTDKNGNYVSIIDPKIKSPLNIEGNGAGSNSRGDSNNKIVHVIPENDDVTSLGIFKIVQDLVANDITLANSTNAASEMISEGVFDLNRSTLTQSQENDLAVLYTASIEATPWQNGVAQWDLFTSDDQVTQYYNGINPKYLNTHPAGMTSMQDYLAQLIALKYQNVFSLAFKGIAQNQISVPAIDNPGILFPYNEIVSPYTVTVGSGNLKVFESDKNTDSVYSINQITELTLDPIPQDGKYRRDLIELVFRKGISSQPFLQYTPGETLTDDVTIGWTAAKHTLAAKTLTSSLGTYPLWSILVKDYVDPILGKCLLICSVDQVFEFAGIRSTILYQSQPLYQHTDGVYSPREIKDVGFSDLNGQLLSSDYGESSSSNTQSQVVAGPQCLRSEPESLFLPVPTSVPDINENGDNAFIIPFSLNARYNSYISFNSVEFFQLQLTVLQSYMNSPDTSAGMELNITTIARFYDPIRKTGSLDVPIGGYEADVDYDKIQFNSSLSVFTAITFDNATIDTNGTTGYQISGGKPDKFIPPDIMVVESGTGFGQITSVIGFTDSIVTFNKLEIPLDDTSKVSFYYGASEKPAGYKIADLPAADRTDITAKWLYQYSDRNDRSVLPFNDTTWGYSVKVQLTYNPIGSIGAALLTFPLKIRLNMNQKYLAKISMQQSTSTQFQYAVLPSILMPLHLSTTQQLPWFYTAYYRNAGLYPGKSEDGKEFFKIETLVNGIWYDIEDQTIGAVRSTLQSINGGTQAPYWTPIAWNIDSIGRVAAEYPPNLDTLKYVYVDVLAGKIIFNPNDGPPLASTRITYATDNTVNGKLNSENITHHSHLQNKDYLLKTFIDQQEEVLSYLVNVNMDLHGTLNVAGAASINGVFIVNNTTIINGQTIINDLLTANNGVVVNGGITINGPTVFNGDMTQVNSTTTILSDPIMCLNGQQTVGDGIVGAGVGGIQIGRGTGAPYQILFDEANIDSDIGSELLIGRSDQLQKVLVNDRAGRLTRLILSGANITPNVDGVNHIQITTAAGKQVIGFDTQNGRMAIGEIEPTGLLHITGQPSGPGFAPIKLTASPIILDIPEPGAIEYTGDRLYITQNDAVRRAIIIDGVNSSYKFGNAYYNIGSEITSFDGFNSISASYLTGQLKTAAQPNITSLGPLNAPLINSREFIGNNGNNFRIISQNYGVFFRNDDNRFFIMLTNQNDPMGNWRKLPDGITDDSFPFTIDLNTGLVKMAQGVMINKGLTVGQSLITDTLNVTSTFQAATISATDALVLPTHSSTQIGALWVGSW